MIPQTGIGVIDWFLAALATWGYLIVLGFTIFENLFVVGSFTPGETVVIAAALVASRGSLSIAGVWLASVVGTVIGGNVSYWIGRRAGMGTVSALIERIATTRIGRLFNVDTSGLDEVTEHFHTQGSKTVLISRFAIGAKNFVPAVAGATRMPAFWFELYTLIGAVLYTSLMCAIGWFLGANLDYALHVASAIGWVGLAILALFIGSIVTARNRIKARRERRESDDDA